MRIVGGASRGLRLAGPGPADVTGALRPTADRVRESLFNLLAHGGFGDPAPPAGRQVLDLFAGTGALGLEALSRGAETTVFVEHSRGSLALLERNVARIDHPGTRVLRRDATRLGPCPGPSCDLVFLDPPYGKGLGERALTSAQSGGWIAPNALIVWEEALSPEIPSGMSLIDTRRYGGTVISILQADAS